MAKIPPAAAAPPPDAADDDGATPGADTPPAAGDEAADQPTVLLTVMDNGDGTYTLIKGDEDADSDESPDDADAAAGAAGTTPPATAAAPGADEDQGQTFDSPGALLKGILDLLKDHESEASGEGSDDDNFSAGFAGGSSASPAKPTMASKY